MKELRVVRRALNVLQIILIAYFIQLTYLFPMHPFSTL